MNQREAGLPESDLDELFLRYCDGALNSEEIATLARRIRECPDGRAQFLSLCLQAASLPEQQAVFRETRATVRPVIGALDLDMQARGGRPGSSHVWRIAAVACLFASVAAVVLALVGHGLELGAARPARSPLGSISRSTGLVRIQNIPIDPRAVGIPNFHSGDTVSTIGMESSAELTLNDGTSVMLSSDTEAMFEGALGNSVTVRHGNLAAAVKPQAQNVPLRISTPEANVAVDGTQMLLTRAEGKTRVGVVEGKVRMTDPTNQVALDLNAGDQVEALSGAMRRVPTPPVPDSVAFRFSPGTRSGWQLGRLSLENLLPGSLGSLRTIPKVCDDGLLRHTMESENCWTSGMFSIHPDTWVNLRYRVQEQGWFEMIVVARSYDIRHRPGVVFAAPPDIMNCQPGVWRTVHYRLADFGFLQRPEVPSPLVGFLLGLNSAARDVGLSVDRVWINRGESPAPFPD